VFTLTSAQVAVVGSGNSYQSDSAKASGPGSGELIHDARLAKPL